MAATLTTPLTPSYLTILLKHHKSTVLLSVLPSTPLTTLKTLLLAALTSRGIVAFPSASIATSLPTNPDDLQLGILVDKKDSSKGFKLLVETPSEGSGGNGKKGKGRASNSRASGSTATAGGDGGEATVEAAGLVDGSWVAYRIRPAGANHNGKGVKDEDGEEDNEEEEDGAGVIDIDMEDDPGWDVVVPNFEEMDADAIEKEEEGAEGDEDDIPIPDVTRVR